tara:strand:+ start:4284 stop:18035 length:13752 start_codon:yes stop_codon:yes gene_type:complete
MPVTGIATHRVKFNNVVQNQLPQYVRNEFPLIENFLKQYYISQEFDGAPVDLIQNIDQYVKVDEITNLTDSAVLKGNITEYVTTINVNQYYSEQLDGFPDSYGIIKIDNEIITYTGKTANSFTGCVRGFSGISSHISPDNPEQLVFESTNAATHLDGATIHNLSNLFLKEFLRKTKRQILPLLDERQFSSDLDENVFIKQSKDFYSSRGTDRSFEILFKSLYNKEVDVVKPREFLFTPSNSDYRVTNDLIVEAIEGDPTNLELATLIQQPYAFGSGIEKAYAPITAVEKIVSNEGNNFYQLSIDAGYSRDISVDGATYGKFSVIPRTRNIGQVSAGATFFDVDSTVGFGTTGELSVTYNDASIGIVSYTSKSLTQFYGVTNVTSPILDGTNIGIDTCAYGQSTVDSTERIKVRINSVINRLEYPKDAYYYNAGDTANISALGRKSRNFKTKNWVYNNYALYNVKSVSLVDSSDQTWDITLFVDHDFKINDSITIVGQDGVDRNGQVVDVLSVKSLTIKGQGGLNINETYTINRNISKTSSTTFIDARKYACNVQNVYEDDKEIVVASPSLPSYTINTDDRTVKFSGTYVGTELLITSGSLADHGYYTGDAIQYDTNITTTTSYDGWGNTITKNVSGERLFPTGLYFVKRVSANSIKLAKSRTDLFNGDFVEVESSTTVVDQTIKPYSFKDRTLSSQKLIRKFADPVYDGNANTETNPGYTGMLCNGVEILNYKSNDVVYYGQIDKIDVLDPGLDYDVVNPPSLLIEDSVGTGATGSVSVKGVLTQLRVLDTGFDYLDKPTVTISGGNGTPSEVLVNMKKIDHSTSFFADLDSDQVGLGTTSGTLGEWYETIGFSTFHKFRNNEKVIYDSGNQSGVGGLSTNAVYYVSTMIGLGNTTESFTKIKLYPTLSDSLAGINTVVLTSYGEGRHALRSFEKKSVLAGINVVSGGIYENKQRKVAASGVSTSKDQITIKDHDYKDGEIIKYTAGDSGIGGLTDGSEYYITKIDNDTFKLSTVGVGTTSGVDFYQKTKQYINLTSIGVGTHTFNYPGITVTVSGNVGVASTGLETFQASVQPIIRGTITSATLDDKGSGYGTGEIINYNRKPDVSLISGEQAQITPIVVDGKIVEVVVLNKGKQYSSPPDIRISGDGTGASVTPILSDGLLSSVKVVESGSGYTQQNTSGIVVFTGRGANFDPHIQKWTVNLAQKNRAHIDEDDGIIEDGINRSFGLQYSHVYAPRKYRQSVSSVDQDGNILYGNKDLYKEQGQEQVRDEHSPIMGWAYDGHPIYGPYGYISKEGGLIERMRSGYIEEASKKTNRPSLIEFPAGFFVEDYTYKPLTQDTVLDKNNGRFCVTPEFPNGTYAYFATIDNIISQEAPFSGYFEPVFPYFIGDSFYAKPNEFNLHRTSNQDEFDLNDTEYYRNTKPYNLIEGKINYKYLTIPNNLNQTASIKGVSPGRIEKIGIVTAGSGYRVNDELVFDNTGTKGAGVSARVSKLKGVSVDNISVATSSITGVEIYPFTKNEYILYSDNPHNFNNLDIISITGLSTESSGLEGNYIAGIETGTYVFAGVGTTGGGGLGPATSTGMVSDINVVGNLGFNHIRENDIIGIGTEEVRVLNVLENASALRIERGVNGVTGTSHTAGAVLRIDQRKIKINAGFKTDHNYRINKQIYFNPSETVGLGTTSGVGIGTTIFFTGITSTNLGISSIYIPTQALYIPGHNLKTGDQVTYSPGNGGSGMSVGMGTTTPENAAGITTLTDGQTLYVAKYSNDIIGLATVRVGLGTTGIFVGLVTNYPLGRQTPLYFRTLGVGNSHSIKTNYSPITGEIVRNLVTIDTGISTHGIHVGHDVDVDVNTGTTTSFDFQYDDFYRKLIVNPRSFDGGNITTSTNSITITDHNWQTGQKIIHQSDGPAEGLGTNEIYYVVKVDKDTIKLSDSYYNATQFVPKTIGIGTTGTNGSIKPINPPLEVYRDATVTFTLANGSLGYEVQGTSYPAFQLNFYKDSNFKYQYDTNDLEKKFNVQRVGVTGVDGTAKVTLSVNKNTPDLLYYKLDTVEVSSLPAVKSEINVDGEVRGNNEFASKTSLYNGTFRVSAGAADTSFSYSVTRIPENTSYISTENATILYTTNCTHTVGPIADVEIKDAGKNYYSLPGITTITTGGGKNAVLEPSSTSIGLIKTVNIDKIGFDLSIDKTVRPSVILPNIIKINSFASFESIGISSQGKGYSTAPSLKVFDGKDDTLITDLDLRYDTGDTSVEILKNTYGMNNVPPKIIPTGNTNGVGISTVGFNTITKYATITLDVGFSTANTFPFVVGDRVLIEGISVGVGSTGKGFNSSAYNYKLFTITSTDPNIGGVGATVSYSLDGDYDDGEIVGLYDGDNSAGRIIAEKTFPVFNAILKFNDFAIGETVESDTTSGSVEAWDRQNGILRVSTSDNFVVNERIKGLASKTEGLASSVTTYNSSFELSPLTKVIKGSETVSGFLNESIQRVQDSLYYQNFSYALRSEVDYDTWDDAISASDHTAGFKKFSDYQLVTPPTEGTDNNMTVGISSNSMEITNELVGFVDLNCVYDFDLVRENVLWQGGGFSSDEIYFNSRILTDYYESAGNRVLLLDDFSGLFNSNPRPTRYSLVDQWPLNTHRSLKYFLFYRDRRFTGEKECMVVDLVHDGSYSYMNQYGGVDTKQALGTFDFQVDGIDGQLLFFPYKYSINDYDIGFIAYSLDDNILGIGTTNIGGIAQLDTTSCSTWAGGNPGFTTTLVSVGHTYRSMKLLVSMSNNNNEHQFNELNIVHDNTDAYAVDYGELDTSQTLTRRESTGFGTYYAYLDSGNMIVKFIPKNNGIGVTINTIQVGLGSDIPNGIGTANMLHADLIAKSTAIESSGSPGFHTVGSYNENFDAGYFFVQVSDSTNNMHSVHEILVVDNDTDDTVGTTYDLEYGVVETNTGLGTFGSRFNGTTRELLFTPKAGLAVTVTSYMNAWTFLDAPSDTLEFNNGMIRTGYGLYEGTENAIKRSFDLTHELNPVFERYWVGNDSNIVSVSADTIKIPNHFWVSGESVKYKHNGGITSAIGIGQSNFAGIGNTTYLPEDLFIIKISEDKVKLASSAENALKRIPIALDITSVGIGTSHRFVSTNQNAKAILSIDNVIQSPVVATAITTVLSDQVWSVDEHISVSGITSFFGSDIIKVGDEIMKIKAVGVGSTNQFKVRRGWMGTQIGYAHTNTLVTKINGNYNIIDNVCTFAEAPFGNVPLSSTTNAPDERDWIGIATGSSFQGRTFMRSGVEDEANETYYRNLIFDDFSNDFNGIDKSFTLKSNGSNVSGFSTENAVMLINDVFQAPGATSNYTLAESSGVTTATFTGFAASIGNDVNTAGIPLGGVLLSVGSTEGLGYQPLVSAGGTVTIVSDQLILGTGLTNPGSISTITIGNTGSGYRARTEYEILTEIASPVGIGSTVIYLKNRNSVFGLIDLLNTGSNIKIGIGTWTSPVDVVSVGGTFVRFHPDHVQGHVIPVDTPVKIEVSNPTVGFANVTAIVSDLQDGGFIGLSTAAYNPMTGIMTVTTLSEHGMSEGDHIKIRDKTLAFSCNAGVGVHTYSGGTVGAAFTDNSNNAYTVTDAAYVGSTGLLTLTIGSHSLTTSNDIWIGANKIVFTCDEDGHATDHPYPRTTDPAYNTGLDIVSKTATTITVNVGIGSTTDAKLYPRESDPISGRWIKTSNVSSKSFEVQVLDNAPSTNRSTHVFQYAHPNAIVVGEKIPEYHVGFATILTGTGHISTNVSITNTEQRFYSKRTISNVGYNSVTGMTTVTTTTPHGLIDDDFVKVSGIAFTCDYKSEVNISGIAYSAASGIMTVTTSAGHGLTTYGTVASTVILTGIGMTCQLDNGSSTHTYPRTNDPTYNGNKVLEVLSSTQFVVNVGISTVPTFYQSGGTAQGAIIAPRPSDPASNGSEVLRVVSPTSFEINSGISTRVHRYARGGTVDKITELEIDSPLSYENLPLYYSSSSISGVGSNATVDLTVGAGSSVLDFSIDLKGYGYGVGEKLTIPRSGLTGIPTTSDWDGNEFLLTVQKVFKDEFTGWTLGELQLLDSPQGSFDGNKRSFNITLAGSLISILAKRGSRINVQDVLLVFVNDVLQVPGRGYEFPGGSLITFSEAPKEGDTCKILFYKGTGSTDVTFVEVIETVKPGDMLTISANPDKGHPYYWNENGRMVLRIDSTDKVTTPIYNGPGNVSDETLSRPVKWCRQTEDKFINEKIESKDRQLYEPIIHPYAHIIKSVGIGSTVVYVNNVRPFFNPSNENDQTVTFQDKVTFINQDSLVGASATAIVSAAGTISSIDVTSGGVGYSTATVSVASTVGIGTSTQCFGNVTISAGGTVSGIAITSPGVGYTSSNPPVVLITPPTIGDKEENSVVTFAGEQGIIVGFGSTNVGVGTTQLFFDLHIPLNSYLRNANIAGAALTLSVLQQNDYFMVFDSCAGTASTTIRSLDNQTGNVVGIGSSFIDNVYVVKTAEDIDGPAGYDGIGNTTLRRVFCDIQDDFTHDYAGLITSTYWGSFSWGRIDVKSRAGLNSYTAYTLGGIGTNDVTGIQTSMKVQRTVALKYKNYDT